jgi:hypothetical protein
MQSSKTFDGKFWYHQENEQYGDLTGSQLLRSSNNNPMNCIIMDHLISEAKAHRMMDSPNRDMDICIFNLDFLHVYIK